MVRITETIEIAEWEITERFVTASGPGGQNVNKTATAVELRFEAQNSPNLPVHVKARLKRLAGQRWTKDGAIIIRAERHRKQLDNRRDAMERLVALIKKATEKPKPRLKTRVSLSQKRKRVEAKRRRADVKKMRQRPEP